MDEYQPAPRATAPASSANLGPGFDCVALALDLRCSVTVAEADQWSVVSNGEPMEASLLFRSMGRSAGAPLAVVVDSSIPRARGLGSSAAVATAMAAATIRLTGREPSSRELFDLVSDFEGHCDNAAAAVYGGLVSVFSGEVLRLELSDRLVPIVAVPAERLPTNEARAALPETVPHDVAARSIARAIFLIEGLRTGERKALRAAAGDEMHEAPRSVLSDATTKAIAAAIEAGALHASWSGAGPATIAFAEHDTVSAVSDAMAAAIGDGGEVMLLPVSSTGWA